MTIDPQYTYFVVCDQMIDPQQFDSLEVAEHAIKAACEGYDYCGFEIYRTPVTPYRKGIVELTPKITYTQSE